jgi:putative transposase
LTELVIELASKLGSVTMACQALAVKRNTHYYRLLPKERTEEPRTKKSHRRLSDPEREEILAVLHEERFVDKAPAQIYAALLDENRYLCSISTMYRILAQAKEIRERRSQLRHPEYSKPELLATGPNQVWSWDATKLKGPHKWTYFYLYVVIDVFSRHVVGWTVSNRGSGQLAKALLEETCARQQVTPQILTIHSDRGPEMISKAVANLLADLGVTKSVSRPYVSDDNPFSESHFKTLKYHSSFPASFGCLEDARIFCQSFFKWYNEDHYHSGIGLMTPAAMHYGLADGINAGRQIVLSHAFDLHPERFTKGRPKVLELPKEVWINKPVKSNAATISSITIISDTAVSVL